MLSGCHVVPVTPLAQPDPGPLRGQVFSYFGRSFAALGVLADLAESRTRPQRH
jgi:hypothetical protein